MEDFAQNTLLNTKRLFFDQSGKPIPEATIQAMKIALQHQKAQMIRFTDGEQTREFTKLEILPTFKNMQTLIHQCLQTI